MPQTAYVILVDSGTLEMLQNGPRGRAGQPRGRAMRKRLAVIRVHAAEPEPDSFRAVTGDGGHADLFNLNHYPVHAVCRVCNGPIRAETFLRAFRHEES